MTPIGLLKLRDWLFIAPIAIAAFALGFWGFEICGIAACAVGSPLGALSRTFGLIKGTGNFAFGQAPWQLVVAQFLIPLLALIGGFKLALQNIRRDFRVVLARRMRDHAIVCGLGETGRQIVESFLDAGWPVAAITLDTDAPNAVACERRGVAVLKGDASQPAMLKLAGLKRARALILACASDATNIEIGMRARDAVAGIRGGASALMVLPELRSDWLYNVLNTHRAATLGTDRVSFRLFNLSANAARSLLQSPQFRRLTAPDENVRPHLLVAGLGQMGAEIALQAARGNFALPGVRLSVTVLDSRGEASGAALEAKCPRAESLADFVFLPCAFRVDDPAAWAVAEKTLHEQPPAAVVVALKDDATALNTALGFRRRLDREDHFDTPVFVRLRQQRKLGAFLAGLEADHLRPGRLVPFGDLAELTRPSTLIDQTQDALARAAHEAWLARETTKSPAAVPWGLLPERFKQSNRAFADHIAIKLQQLGLKLARGAGPPHPFSEAEIETLAEMEHWRWCVEQRALGWEHGPSRDDILLRHPLLVDWPALPEDIRAMNRDIVRRIPEIVAGAGMTIVQDETQARTREAELPAAAQ